MPVVTAKSRGMWPNVALFLFLETMLVLQAITLQDARAQGARVAPWPGT